MNVKINNGFTDADFDPKNTAYKFHAKEWLPWLGIARTTSPDGLAPR